MLHVFWLGLFLGWAAAVPIGPVNLEMTRRNLTSGTLSGLGLGFGACFADITFLILLGVGALVFLQHPQVLRMIGLVGGLVLIGFGLTTLKPKVVGVQSGGLSKKSMFRNGLEGYLMTLSNPYTILFWASVSAQLSWLDGHQDSTLWYAGVGVIMGVVSWALGLNILLHYTRHRLPDKFSRWLNIFGGVLLIVFGAMGFLRSLFQI